MLRVGIHVTVTSADGTAVVEIAGTQTVISPDHKNVISEVDAAVEALDRIMADAKEQYHVQMMDFGKVLSNQ